MTWNKSQPFKELFTLVITLVNHWSACKCNNMQADLVFNALPAYTSTLIAHYMGSFFGKTSGTTTKGTGCEILHCLLYGQ